MYQSGQGVNQNNELAFEWYEKAANQGNIFAQSNLGWMYEVGEGTKKDYNKALYWHLKSADEEYKQEK